MADDSHEAPPPGAANYLSPVRAFIVLAGFLVAVGVLVAVGTRPSVSGDALATTTTTTVHHHTGATTTTTTIAARPTVVVVVVISMSMMPSIVVDVPVLAARTMKSASCSRLPCTLSSDPSAVVQQLSW